MRLYDTLSRSLVELPPPPGPIRMYVCGSTVYQRIHVGNSRPFTLAMWLRGWLRGTGYEVTLVHNITDVDDKVYAESARQGIPSRELSARATEWFFEDTSDLGLGRPDVEPKATETIPEIVSFIEELLARDHAYVAGGDVYFSVGSFPDYGRLSGARLEDMVSQESSDLKRDQRDFALWKAQKAHEDAAWDSPWGPGRPGWHIECSAMAEKFLGHEFEIHGGGTDLRFPHHENELAQSALARPSLRAGLDAQRDARARRGEDVEVGRKRRDAARRARHAGGAKRCSSSTSPATGASHSTSRTRSWTPLQHERSASARCFAARVSRLPTMPGSASPPRSRTTSTRPPRSPSCTSGATTTSCAGRSGSSGSSRSPSRTTAPAEVVELAERRVAARAAEDFAEADRLRGEIEDAGWDVRDEADGFRLVRRR